MVKRTVLLWLWAMYVFGQGSGMQTSQDLESECLQCHKTEQIPDSLIYRRYLMQYSTPERISEAMLKYLKTPKKTDSIMPLQFFLKFPMKKKMEMDERELNVYIRRYIETFDIKRRLVLP